MTSEELQQLVESNARAIQALTDRIAETDTITRRHSDEIVTLAEMVARFALEAAADRREVRRSVDEIRQSVGEIRNSVDDVRQLFERHFGENS